MKRKILAHANIDATASFIDEKILTIASLIFIKCLKSKMLRTKHSMRLNV